MNERELNTLIEEFSPNRMDELLTLIERYSPGHREEVAGWTSLFIDDLEEAFGRPLPSFYREFAGAMGKKGGRLLSDVKNYNTYSDVREYYAPPYNGESLPPRRFLYILGDTTEPDPVNYYLDLEAPSEDGDAQVVRIPYGKDAWKTVSGASFISFREMLYLWAMDKFLLSTFPHQANYSQDRSAPLLTPDAFAQTLEKLGFSRLPYPQHSMLFERADAALELYRPPDGQILFTLRVGFRSLKGLKQLQSIIEDNTSMERFTWPGQKREE
ncbi:hypothetical protein HUA76_08760 [Myxococcus sp. CA056]|uniref:hypothetical protein n=1 Tax=Myxococcus sp. CA056 TaxID=2741740 RepID=UPI00157AEFB7|nr:hypothetical protein [Myxococcus sp. CA056]NTX10873.1 hypothetical protein [Myxococcus sp. CA056]